MKVLYSPEQQGTINQMGGTTGMEQQQGGIDYDMLRQFLGGQAMKKGQWSTAWSILKPEGESVDDAKFRKMRERAGKIIDTVEAYYFDNKLAKGWPSGLLDELEAMVTLNSAYARYKRLAKSVRVDLARIAGDTGNLALQEQLVQEKLLPDARFNKKDAQEMFKLVRTRFNLPQSKYTGGLKK